MKKQLISTAIACLLLAGCSGPVIPDHDGPIGGDWRTWRGYTQPYTLSEPEDIVFSRYTPSEDDPNSYGYAAYDNTYGSRIGALNLPDGEGFTPDNEADPTIINKDLDGDGIYEFGLSYKDGRVVWYQWTIDLLAEYDVFTSNPFVIIGLGDTEGVQEGYDYSTHLSHRMFRLTDNEAVKAILMEPDEAGNFQVDIYSNSTLERIGALKVSSEMGMDRDLLDTTYGIRLVSEDRGDGGYYQLGIPFGDKVILWYSYHPENDIEETFLFEDMMEIPEDSTSSEVDGILRLDEYTEIHVQFSQTEQTGIDVIDSLDEFLYGTIRFNDPDITANDILCEDGEHPSMVTKDLDEDGNYEIGVKMLDGTVCWNTMSDGEFVEIGIGDVEGTDVGGDVDLFDILVSVAGKKLEGMTLIQSEDIEINGLQCEQYIAGTDHEDHFTAEDHYAVSPDGTVYILDIQHGNEYVVLEPEEE